MAKLYKGPSACLLRSVLRRLHLGFLQHYTTAAVFCNSDHLRFTVPLVSTSDPPSCVFPDPRDVLAVEVSPVFFIAETADLLALTQHHFSSNIRLPCSLSSLIFNIHKNLSSVPFVLYLMMGDASYGAASDGAALYEFEQ